MTKRKEDEDDQLGGLDALHGSAPFPLDRCAVRTTSIEGGILARLRLLVDDAGGRHAEGDEGELPPVEEGPAEQRRLYPVVERDEQRNHDGWHQQPVPAASIIALLSVVLSLARGPAHALTPPRFSSESSPNPCSTIGCLLRRRGLNRCVPWIGPLRGHRDLDHVVGDILAQKSGRGT